MWYHRMRLESRSSVSSHSYRIHAYNKPQAMAAASSPLPITGPIELAAPVLGVGDPLREVELPVLLLLTLATATPLTPVAFLH